MHHKVASSADFDTAQQIMERIRTEDPSYWPYGLDVNAFDGGLWLVSKSASHEPVGFVGWQNRIRDSKKVGYYVIGILPEYRNRGFAKQAVAEVMRIRGKEVDEVRALIMEHNTPSKALGRALDVSIEEVPLAKAANRTALLSAAGALGSSMFFDQAADPSRTFGSTLQPWNWDKERALMGGLNALLGAGGGGAVAKDHYLAGAGILALAPTKDLAMKGIGSLHKMDRVADETAKNLVNKRINGDKALTPADWSSAQKMVAGGALGLGAVGVLAAILNARKKRKIEQQQAEAAAMGRVKVTLPTKNPGDAETTIDVPIEEINMSQALRDRLGRDTRRRLYEETKARTRPRKPKDPTAPTDKEIVDMQLVREMEELGLGKAAAAPAPGMPSPPPPIGNPALRMVGQQQAANQQQASTAQNPQIMQAQQQTAMAEQQLQQQQADAQMQVQQAQMQSQQQSQQQQQQWNEQMLTMQQKLNQAQQQQELLKLQVQKAKVEADLSKHFAKLKSESGKGQESETGKLLIGRIDRIRKRVKSAATTAPAASTEPAPPPFSPVRPYGQSLRELNSNPAAVSTGLLHRPGSYRVSTGALGDFVYKNFIRGYVNNPVKGKPQGWLPTLMQLNSPDRMGVIGSWSDTADEMRSQVG